MNSASHKASSQKCPRFYQRAEGSPIAHSIPAGDPSLRLKNGFAQDDAAEEEEEEERKFDEQSKLSGYPQLPFLLPPA